MITPTPYAVHCTGSANPPDCLPCTLDLVFLTHDEYMRQLGLADQRWHCPRCNSIAEWDNENYESKAIPGLEEVQECLADMVAQNCSQEKDGSYFSGFISTHAEALSLLCRLGVMRLISDNGGRVVTARFKEGDPRGVKH